MKTFKIQWASGRVEFLKGIDITSALVDARHSKSAIRAIKKYEEVLVTKEVDIDRSCSSFAKYLAEHVTSSNSTILTSNRHSKDKRAQRRKRKVLDKIY